MEFSDQIIDQILPKFLFHNEISNDNKWKVDPDEYNFFE